MKTATRLALGIWLVSFFLGPWLWMALVSFKKRAGIYTLPKRAFADLTIDNYSTTLIDKAFHHDLSNSLLLAILSSLVAMAAAIPAAYAISRHPYHMGKYYTFILSTRFLPAISVVIPLFVIFSAIGLQGTILGITLVHASIALSLSVILLRAYFDRVPRWLDEAARLDGAGTSGVLLAHVIPAAAFGLLVTWFLTFLVSWNEFLLASILTSTTSRTLPVVIPGLVTPHGTYWGQVAALGVVASFPGAIITIFMAIMRTKRKSDGA